MFWHLGRARAKGGGSAAKPLTRASSALQARPTLIPWDEKINVTALYVAFGICLGVSFFAFVRNLNLTFDQLGNFDPANLSAVLRFSLVGIIAVILCVLLSAGLVKVDIAGVKFEDI